MERTLFGRFVMWLFEVAGFPATVYNQNNSIGDALNCIPDSVFTAGFDRKFYYDRNVTFHIYEYIHQLNVEAGVQTIAKGAAMKYLEAVLSKASIEMVDVDNDIIKFITVVANKPILPVLIIEINALLRRSMTSTSMEGKWRIRRTLCSVLTTLLIETTLNEDQYSDDEIRSINTAVSFYNKHFGVLSEENDLLVQPSS